ncbi:MAG TPA: GT4 family glycosyltransferase PelF [Balneolales bacterium]|nr:GT4 family glycosyltransferase PelF [Balneolales bacterium]
MESTDRPIILLATEDLDTDRDKQTVSWATMLKEGLRDEFKFINVAFSKERDAGKIYKHHQNIFMDYIVPEWDKYDTNTQTTFAEGRSYAEYLKKKARTTQKEIDLFFIPVFRDFMECLKNPARSQQIGGQAIYGLWKYFQYYDYKKTLSNQSTWTYFKQFLKDYIDQQQASEYQDLSCLFDVTSEMHVIYQVLKPIVMSIPRTNVSMSALSGFSVIPSIVSKFEYGVPFIITEQENNISVQLHKISQSDFPYSIRKILSDFTILLTSIAYYYADQILPVCGSNKTWELQLGAETEKIQIVPNGIDTRIFKPQSKPDRLKHRPTVVSVNPIVPIKDIETMIKSCKVISEKIPEILYLVYGDLDMEPEYVYRCRRLIHKLHLEHNFKLAGLPSSVSACYNEGDIYLVSSKYEGISHTMLEAMSCGKPVISTNVGNMKELLNENGIICKKEDPVELGEAVMALFKYKGLRREMAQNSRKIVLENYSKEHFVNQYSSILNQILKKHRDSREHLITVPSVKKLLMLDNLR